MQPQGHGKVRVEAVARDYSIIVRKEMRGGRVCKVREMQNSVARFPFRMEWLNMKEMFKNLQKTHMKSVKSETAVAAAQSRERGFVKDCLVKVELEQEWEESHRSGLKVSGSSWTALLSCKLPF